MDSPADFSLTLVRELISKESYTEAVEELQKIFAADPDNKGALCLLGETLYRLGQPEQALALFSNAVQSSGVDAQILGRISEILSELGRNEEAADFLMFAAEADPSDAELLHKAVDALEAAGRGEDAAAIRALGADR